MCVKKRFIFDLRRCNDDYFLPTLAQVSSVGFGGEGSFQASVNEAASDDGARFVLAPPLRPPHAARRRSREHK